MNANKRKCSFLKKMIKNFYLRLFADKKNILKLDDAA